MLTEVVPFRKRKSYTKHFSIKRPPNHVPISYNTITFLRGSFIPIEARSRRTLTSLVRHFSIAYMHLLSFLYMLNYVASHLLAV